MKKIYSAPIVRVIEIECGGALLQASGKYDSNSINKEEEETLVKGSRSFSATSVDWEDWN